MSQYIDNTNRRKQTLKNVLRQLNNGRSVTDVQAEFSTLVKEVNSAEIAQIEQELIAEGTNPEEIKKLCDVHVAVFRQSLDRTTSIVERQGHPVQIMQAENRILGRFLLDLNKSLQEYQSSQTASQIEIIRKRIEKLIEFNRHYLRKENLLFPFLEKYGFQGPSKVMWGIHDDIREMWKRCLEIMASTTLPDAHELTGLVDNLNAAMRSMIYKEEKILFPSATEKLTQEDWIAIRNQEEEIGWFMISPGVNWPPGVAGKNPEMPEKVATKPGYSSTPTIEDRQTQFPLQVGALSLEQINLMLTHLPVDITFVDENDEVRFFSQTRDRIFPRVPAIIGRKVQNCHPPQSVDRVQKIIDSFRAGTRDEAAFWIQMHGKFIHIRYFALRDESKYYRGTLEVTQEISDLRALEGERRILDE